MLKLKQVLIDKGVSLRQLAQMMNVSPATISQLINHNQRVREWAAFEKSLIASLQKPTACNAIRKGSDRGKFGDRACRFRP